LKDAGVRIGLGTDSGTTHRYPGYFEHRELELLVDAGLSPREAVDAATATSAAVLGQTGTLTEGAPADFLVLASNPLENVANTRDIIAVYVGGKAIERMNRPGADGT
jgi:imidazolonepropionase-like amidohydrolase